MFTDRTPHSIHRPRLSRWLAIAAATALAASATSACKRSSAEKISAAAAAAFEAPERGALAPKVEVLAFIDFECPYTRGNAKALLELADKHKDSVRVRFLHLPMSEHPGAVLAARGAVAAHKQKAFFKFYESMMESKSVGREAMLAWADKAGIDAKKFAADLDSSESAKLVQRDLGLAKTFGATGTPSFLINGALYLGVQPAEFWEKKITEEKSRADALLAAGTPSVSLMKAVIGAANPGKAPDYIKYVIEGQQPPEVPLPTLATRTSGVEAAQIQPAGAGGAAVQLGNPATSTTAGEAAIWRVQIRQDDPRLGPDSALVTVVIFEDMECPYCAKMQPVLRKLVDDYQGKLRVVFKHNPGATHANAFAAAEALEAARTQGKFWEMHDYLLTHQKNLDAAGLSAAAEAATLDKAQYATALAAHGAKARIEADMEQALALSARGTPILFINGKKLTGARDEAILKPLIDAEVLAAQAMVRGGVAPDKVFEAITAKGLLLESLAPEAKTIALPPTAPSRGGAGASIEIVAFQDFQCPFSARLDPHLRELEAEMPGRLKITWVDFPLDKIHPLAKKFAEAGQEAQAQGKFWEFHKAVMDNNDKLDETLIMERAKLAGLDLKKLKAALEDGRHAAAVDAHGKLGGELGVRGTPTVFINGHLFMPQTGFSANTFRVAIKRLLGGD